MTEQKLKPCPFCGSNKIRICVGTIDNGVPCDMDKPYYQVRCCSCGCVVDNYDNRTKEDVIKAWTKRVPQTWTSKAFERIGEVNKTIEVAE
jgi:hypothetical protein